MTFVAMVLVFTGVSIAKYFSGDTSDCGRFGKLTGRGVTEKLHTRKFLLVIELARTNLVRRRKRANY